MIYSHVYKQNTRIALSKQKQKDCHKLKGSLVYIENYRLARATYCDLVSNE